MHHNHSVIIVQRASDQIIYFSLHLSINLESFLIYFPLLNTLCLKALVCQQSKDHLVQLTNKCKFKSEQPGYRATGWIHLTEGYGGKMSLGPLLTLQPIYCSDAWCMYPVGTQFSINPVYTGDIIWEILAQRHWGGLFAGITARLSVWQVAC